MLVTFTRKQAQEIVDGILSGDGDIGGRMVCDQVAIPAYPRPMGLLIPWLYDSMNPQSELYGQGRQIADEFLSALTFPEPTPTLED